MVTLHTTVLTERTVLNLHLVIAVVHSAFQSPVLEKSASDLHKIGWITTFFWCCKLVAAIPTTVPIHRVSSAVAINGKVKAQSPMPRHKATQNCKILEV